ncbi:MAG: TetR family transcriptional regulator [Myxococcales bacterium]|nr:TetR family transcriptional regulator [Myxococcales bacterium]
MSEIELDERAQRIVDTAIALAERDGFAAVRLRDVASTAQVALGTVYKRFASKEAILVAALEQEADRLLGRFGDRPVPGASPSERVCLLIQRITDGMARRPNLTRALMRSIASGDPSITGRVAGFHALITALVIAAIRGDAPNTHAEYGGGADQRERNIALVLQQVWFAALVGWAGGLHDMATVVAQVEMTAHMLLRGAPGATTQATG